MHLGLRVPKTRHFVMTKLAWRSAFTYKLRLFLTILAVVVGTGFISGSLLLTHSLDRSFSSMLDAGVEGVDVGMVGPQSNINSGVPFSVVEAIASRSDVRAVNITGDGNKTPSGTQKVGQSALVVTNPQGDPIQAGSSGSHPFAVYPQGHYVGPEPVVVDGSTPVADDEVMINEQAANRGNIHVGDQIKIVTVNEVLTVKVTGIFQSSTDTAGWIGVGFPLKRYLELFTDGNNATQIVIAAAPGTNAMDLRNAIGRKYGSTYTVLTASQISERVAGTYRQQLGFITYMLTAFGCIALIIGSFLVTNTFSMTLSQRTREFALLRSIGIFSRQIQRSVLIEAIFVGVIGSLIGISLGIGGVYSGVWLINKLGDGMSQISLAFEKQIIIIPFVVGLLVTLFAVIGPMLGIAKLLPIDALRSRDRTENRLRARTILGTIFLTLTVVGGLISNLVTSVNGVNLTTDQRLAILGISAITGLIGMSLVGPAWSKAGMSLFQGPAYLFGRALGRLASRNAIRNPRRTSTTAMALILGVGLVGCVTVIGSTTKQSVYGVISSKVSADFVLDSIGGSNAGTLTSENNSGAMSIPEAAMDTAKSVRGVASTADVMVTDLNINHWDHKFAVVDNDISSYIDIGVRQGTTDVNSDPGVMISAQYAKDANLKLNDEVVVRGSNSPDGIRAKITAIYNDYSFFGHIIIAKSIATQVNTDMSTYQVRDIFIKASGDVNESTLRSNLEKAMNQYLVVQVKNRAEFKDHLGTQVNQMLTIVYCLLVLAVIVGALGIMNTLFLSVSERTREIGMLRAIGMKRSQVRMMMYIESVQIAIQGTIIGLVFGVLVGWGVVNLLSEKGMGQVYIPWDLIGLTAIGSLVLTIVAAVLPAWRASRTPPLEAIAHQ